MKPIYEPKGKAKEYGDLALNIYTGCPHHCQYCYAPGMLHKPREAFHSIVEPRSGIVEETRKQLEKEKITGKLIFLCFVCDPYPTGQDTSTTREIIHLLKEHGNHVQILTKGDGRRDFDLLDGDDWYGVTLSCDTKLAREREPNAASPWTRLMCLQAAKERGIRTWVSFEPVLDEQYVLSTLDCYHSLFDKVKIGKLNYYPSDIDWGVFGRTAEQVCKNRHIDYYIKDSLRAEMEKA